MAKTIRRYTVYRNLHTKTFSCLYNGIVTNHPSELILLNVLLKVSEVGRQRVIREKRKNVHAKLWAESTKGISSQDAELMAKDLPQIYYNPYETALFMKGNTPITTANKLLCFNNKIYLMD